MDHLRLGIVVFDQTVKTDSRLDHSGRRPALYSLVLPLGQAMCLLSWTFSQRVDESLNRPSLSAALNVARCTGPYGSSHEFRPSMLTCLHMYQSRPRLAWYYGLRRALLSGSSW